MWSPTHRVYAAEFKCGVVKIGTTTQPGLRRTDGLRFNGSTPIRFHYGPTHQMAGWPEFCALKRMARMGAVHKGREWFTGVRFEIAKQLVEQVTRNAERVKAADRAKAGA